MDVILYNYLIIKRGFVKLSFVKLKNAKNSEVGGWVKPQLRFFFFFSGGILCFFVVFMFPNV